MGARVIKIERPGTGDDTRFVTHQMEPGRKDQSSYFSRTNAGKESVGIDMSSAEGIAVLLDLARHADVFIENFAPGVVGRLGCDPKAVMAVKPDIVYCSISGYGQTGPSSQLPAYAPVIHAASGFDTTHLSYQEGRERPDYCGIFVADVLVGIQAFGAIGAALNHRHGTGRGQQIDVSMLESMLGLMLNELQGAQFPVPMPTRPLFGPVETADGYVNVAVANEKTFRGLATAAGRADLITDPRFEKYMDRRAHWSEFMDIIETWSRSLTSAECLDQLGRADVPASPYRTVREALADPQIAHRGAFTEVHDGGGAFKVLNQPFKLSAAQTPPGPGVPALGEHTERVLRSLGLGDAEISALR